MSTGGVYFRGNKADLDIVEDLINQLPGFSEEDFNTILNENNLLKTFFTKFSDYYGDADGDVDYMLYEITDHIFSFERLGENLLFLDIGYEGRDFGAGEFPSEEWAYALSETFPNLSFFLAGDIVSNDNASGGINCFIYENGKCIESELFYYSEDDLETDLTETDLDSISGIDATDYDFDLILDILKGYAVELVRAKAEVWKITENNELLMQKTKELTEINDKFEEYLSSLYNKNIMKK
jgi:hypothetical protein